MYAVYNYRLIHSNSIFFLQILYIFMLIFSKLVQITIFEPTKSNER